MSNKTVQQGWQCPVCGKVYAPDVRQCDYQLHFRVDTASTVFQKSVPFPTPTITIDMTNTVTIPYATVQYYPTSAANPPTGKIV